LHRPVANSRGEKVNASGAGYFFLVVATAVALLLARPESAAQTAKPARAIDSSAGNAQNGRRIYTNYGCYECHGREGQGSKLTGPRIGPDPTGFSAFVRYIRRPGGQMPPYTSKVVSDAELADIYAFLKSLPKAPPAKSIPALN
jgi:mono/diheme cytochrome c family protein